MDNMKSMGLDIGYGYTKAISTGQRVIFESLAGSPDLAAFNAGGQEELVVDLGADGRFMVGRDAVHRSTFIDRFENRRWIETPQYKAFFVAALAKLQPGSPIRLVTGLPLSYYADKARLQTRFTGLHRIMANGYDAEIEVVETRVVPQPFGSLFLQAFLPNGEFADVNFLTERIGIIDCGSNHTNFLTAFESADVPGQSTAIDMAVWDLVRAVKSHLREVAPDAEVRDHLLAGAMKTLKISHFGREFDLEPIVAEPRRRLVEQICSTATQVWGSGADLYAIVISGGGANLVGDAVANFFERHGRVKVVKDQFANAAGFYRFAQYLRVQ